MSIQGEINKAIGSAAVAASIAKGVSIAKEKKEKEAEDERKKAEKEAESAKKQAEKDAAKKQADELKAQKQAAAEKKAAEKEEAAKAKEKKIEDRQNLLFLEQSQSKIEAQRRSIRGIDKKMDENQSLQADLKKTISNKRTGRTARREAMASLMDLQEQAKMLKADKTSRERLLKERQSMAENARREFTYGEE